MSLAISGFTVELMRSRPWLSFLARHKLSALVFLRAACFPSRPRDTRRLSLSGGLPLRRRIGSFSPLTFPRQVLEMSLRDIYRSPDLFGRSLFLSREKPSRVLNQRHFCSPSTTPALDFALALHPESLQVGTLHHMRIATAPTFRPPASPAPKPRVKAPPPPPPTEAYPPGRWF